MKTKMRYVVLTAMLVGAMGLTACSGNAKKEQKEEKALVVATPADTHNSRNSLDYEGLYAGTMPCADCEGIYTEITLAGDQFKKKTVYQGKEEGKNTFEKSGKYAWNEKGSIITLDNDQSEQYQVGENQLIALDRDGKRITGDHAALYILRKK